jgi:archaeal flagellar protein FlaJ
MVIRQVASRVARMFPELRGQLVQAGIHDKPDDFVKKIIVNALYLSLGIGLLLFFASSKIKPLLFISIFAIPVIFFGMFMFMIKSPSVYIKKKEREIDREIMFAGRFLLIQVGSGVSLYNSMVSLSSHKGCIGDEFRKIVSKVRMGVHIEKAIDETIRDSPSSNLRRLLWQILNSLKTGSELAKSLESVLEQIAREQLIEVQNYGKKLNPIAMFYMMLAVIIPSLGVTMMIVVSSLVSFQIKLPILIGLAVGLGFFQFMFLSIIKSMRPAVEL